MPEEQSSNVPNVQREFNNAARQPEKAPEPPPGPASVVQIKELNQRRPQPEVTYTYTPDGPVQEIVMTDAARQRNQQINDKIATIRASLEKRRGHAREAFDRHR